MNYRQQIDLQRRVAKYVDPKRMIWWFLAVIVPIALALGILIHLHNQMVEVVTPACLLLRGCVALAAFAAGGTIIWGKVFAPAIRKAREEEEA